MNRFMIIATAAALSVTACTSYAAGHGHKDVKLSDAGYFTDGHDMTLYTFDKDDAGKSNCNAGCAKAWPPLILEGQADALPEGFSVISRKNGDQQVAYNDQPLYLWVQDKKPGQTTGDGVGGTWHIAKP